MTASAHGGASTSGHPWKWRSVMVNLGGGKGSGGDSHPWKQRWPGEWRPWWRGAVTVDLRQLGHYLPFSSRRSPWGAAEPELPSRSVVDLIHPVAAGRLAMINYGCDAAALCACVNAPTNLKTRAG